MVAFTALRDARPQELAEAAQAWERRARLTRQAEEDLRFEVIEQLRSWRGIAAQKALTTLTTLREELIEAVKAMHAIAEVLETAATQLRRAQADLIDAIEYAHRQGLTVEDDGSVSWLDWNPLDWAEDRAAAQRAADLIADALRRATEADTDARADLQVGKLVGADRASGTALSLRDDPRVESAAGTVRTLLAAAGSTGFFEFDGNRDELQRIAATIENLSPSEREALLAQFSDDELVTLRGYLQGNSDSWINPFDANGLGHWARLDLDTALLSTVSADSVTRLTSVWPKLEPTPPDGAEYAEVGGPLDDGAKSWRDVNQGGVGDCWALAVLAGKGRADPGFYENMIQPNPNGTVSVRLYDDAGNPHWVTVTGELPVDGGDLAGARGDYGDANAATTENWPAYVEKALARAYADDSAADDPAGGYDDLNLDSASNAYQYLTGNEAHYQEIEDVSSAEIAAHLESGEPVTISTKGTSDELYIHANESGKLVGNHLYFVKDVLPNGDVVLGNPWGAGHPQGEITLTREELRRYTHGATVPE